MEASELKEKIEQLKRERNAVILAHNYQAGEVQDIADYLGDSLGLSIKASRVDKEVIVFCGVYFMAETAAILAPDKTVLIPDEKARCPMADMIRKSQLEKWKNKNPGSKTVCYVNSTADVKAGCDICCTSSNAIQVVNSLEDREVLFVPDRNLASYVAGKSSKEIIPWNGYCYVHDEIGLEDILEKKRLYPNSEVWVHPECRPEVARLADKVFSTGSMVEEAHRTAKKDILIGTETGIIYRLKKENPEKNFHSLREQAVCRDMKKITLNKVYLALKNMEKKVTVPDEIKEKAGRAIKRMIDISIHNQDG
ncbi:MAG: quinolinate synthase NadA [Candidatus Aminicenantes bacterium]|nr:quinolinate synthase NadA [Candidatus Aminicenantes bacterium]